MEDLLPIGEENVAMEEEEIFDGFRAWPAQSAHNIRHETISGPVIPWDTFSVTDGDVGPPFYDPLLSLSPSLYDNDKSQLLPTETYYGSMKPYDMKSVKNSPTFNNKDFLAL